MATQTATILVSDLVASTQLRSELGDERAETVRREHGRSLIDAADANGGTVVKGFGDGVLVMFAGAAEAVAAGVAMHRAVDRSPSSSATSPAEIPHRCAWHSGHGPARLAGRELVGCGQAVGGKR